MRINASVKVIHQNFSKLNYSSIYSNFVDTNLSSIMKKIIILFVALTAISFTKTPIQEGATINLLCSGKWKIDYIELDSNRHDLPKSRRDQTWLMLYKDGTNDAMSPQGLHKGTWKYNAEKNEITFTENNELTKGQDKVTVQKIKLLNTSKLVLESHKGNRTYTIHFKKG